VERRAVYAFWVELAPSSGEDGVCRSCPVRHWHGTWPQPGAGAFVFCAAYRAARFENSFTQRELVRSEISECVVGQNFSATFGLTNFKSFCFLFGLKQIRQLGDIHGDPPLSGTLCMLAQAQL
jgi:hypothetical protein